MGESLAAFERIVTKAILEHTWPHRSLEELEVHDDFDADDLENMLSLLVLRFCDVGDWVRGRYNEQLDLTVELETRGEIRRTIRLHEPILERVGVLTALQHAPVHLSAREGGRHHASQAPDLGVSLKARERPIPRDQPKVAFVTKSKGMELKSAGDCNHHALEAVVLKLVCACSDAAKRHGGRSFHESAQ